MSIDVLKDRHAGLEVMLDEVSLPAWRPVLEREFAAEAAARAKMDDGEREKALKRAMARAGNDREGYGREFAGYRMQRLTREVLADLYFLSAFFEPVTMKPEEYVMIETETPDQDWTSYKMGEFGGAPERQAVQNIDHTIYDMDLYTSEFVTYPILSLLKGNIKKFYNVQGRMERSLRWTFEDAAKTLFEASVLTSGLRDTLTLDSHIVEANIPDANDMDLSGVDVSGAISVEKIKRLLDYVVRFSSDVETDGQPLGGVKLFVPSTMKRNIWDFADLVAAVTGTDRVEDPKNTIPREAKTEIFRTGTLSNFWGEEVTIVSRNTITAPYVYVSTNKPMGNFYVKPSMDQLHRDTSRELWEKNEEGIQIKKAALLLLHSPWLYRGLRVKM